MKKLLTVIIILFLSSSLLAQDDSQQKMLSVFKKLAARYKDPASLSFEVSYKYAAENKPAEILDSLEGSFKIQHKKYWYRLANTEAAGDSSISVMVFREDGVMYLSKPSVASRNLNPLSLLDSQTSDKRIAFQNVTSENGITKVKITYRPGFSYKTVEYYVDQKSGLLVKMISVVEAKQFYDPTVRDKLTDKAFAVMEADFSHYSEKPADEKQFDLNRYFKKVGNDFIAVAPFDTYKIFLGTPNL